MILGIKYCGGCNPVYDRVAAVNELKESLKDLEISFTPYRAEEDYDFCLLVRGCNRDCVSDKEFSNCRQMFIAVCKEDFLIIKSELRAYCQAKMREE
ncbi:hypothetical protein MCG98_11445 [Ruminococcus sp. OA3]|uniref:hypothetical protein n=1 Tax=Ruminococcus sp. OA3 TaxID=2914164 RepID=UPI001F05BEEA|nr:hypothetical protein [Ruminococcus sp. OA3]MCH1983180.1 hypothetical protein [Ruminococcus sp. OA3]